jgi:ATP-dependent Lon protease
LPLLPLRDIVIYPFMIVPLFVSREKSIRAVDEALGEHRMILHLSEGSRQGRASSRTTSTR